MPKIASAGQCGKIMANIIRISEVPPTEFVLPARVQIFEGA